MVIFYLFSVYYVYQRIKKIAYKGYCKTFKLVDTWLTYLLTVAICRGAFAPKKGIHVYDEKEVNRSIYMNIMESKWMNAYNEKHVINCIWWKVQKIWWKTNECIVSISQVLTWPCILYENLETNQHIHFNNSRSKWPSLKSANLTQK